MVITLFPIGDLMISPLENRFKTNPDLPSSVEGIIILAGSIDPVLSHLWNQTEIHDEIERDLAFLSLAKKYPDALLVYTGGTSSFTHTDIKSADIAKIFFEDLGFNTSHIIFEKNSRNTYENAVNSMNMINPSVNLPWILITSAYHMPRAVGIFCKMRWHIIPYPVDHKTRRGELFRFEVSLLGHLNDLELAIHEWLGLIVYYITGKTSALFPGQCK